MATSTRTRMCESALAWWVSLNLDEVSVTPPGSARGAGPKYWHTAAHPSSRVRLERICRGSASLAAVLRLGDHSVEMADRAELIRQAFVAFDTGDLAPLRALFDPVDCIDESYALQVLAA